MHRGITAGTSYRRRLCRMPRPDEALCNGEQLVASLAIRVLIGQSGWGQGMGQYPWMAVQLNRGDWNKFVRALLLTKSTAGSGLRSRADITPSNQCKVDILFYKGISSDLMTISPRRSAQAIRYEPCLPDSSPTLSLTKRSTRWFA